MKYPKLLLIEIGRHGISTKPPLNLLSLTSFLTENHILPQKNIHILNTETDDIISHIEYYQPDIIGVSVWTHHFELAASFAKKIKNTTTSPLIIGGIHISSLPNSLAPPFDIGVVGEGEQPLADLIQSYIKNGGFIVKHISQIPGIVYLDNNKPVVSPTQKLLAVNKIPKLDYSLIPRERISEKEVVIDDHTPKALSNFYIYTARGCPYNCIFCAYQIIWRGQKKLRFYDVHRVGQEIEDAYRKYHIRCFRVFDDTFAVTKTRLKDLIAEISRRHLIGKIYFSEIYVRANLIDNEFAMLLRQFGVSSVFIGVESGSPNMLRILKNNSLSVEQIKRCIGYLNQNHIWSTASFMLFSPHETTADLEKSYQLASWFCRQPYALSLLFSMTTPFPSTKLWDDAVQEKLFDPKNIAWHNLYARDRGFQTYFSSSIPLITQKFYWNKFLRLQQSLEKKKTKIPGWKKVINQAEKYNRQNLNSLQRRSETQNSRIRWLNRLNHFLKNPFLTLKKILTQPKKIILMIRDI